MEGEPELPDPLPEEKNLNPNPSRPINIHRDSINLSRSFNITCSSTNSSSSSSPPDLVRHFQAAFKRQRPLGMMQTNGIKPRRFLVRQQESSKESNLKRQSTNDVKKSNDAKKGEDANLQGHRLRGSIPQSKICGDNHEVSSITPPSEGDTTVNTNKDNPKPFHSQRTQSGHRSGVNDAVTSGEIERDGGNQVDTSSAANKQDWRHDNFQGMNDNNNISLRSEGGVSSTLPKRDMGIHDQFQSFLQNDLCTAMTQASVVGSSCATSTLINATSAPMISSTTYCSQQQTGGVQLEVAAQPPIYICKDVAGGVVSTGQSTLASQPPINSISSFPMDNKPSGPPNEPQGCSAQDYDICKESCHKGNVSNVKSEPPSLNLPPLDVKGENFKSEKLEKGGGKAVSTSRRKGYDPDLFFKVNGKLYQRLGKIGSGGSSEVHKVISSDCTIYALKKIKLKGRDYTTAYGFCQEILYLNKLKGKNNIIQLIDYEVTDETLLQEVMGGSMSNKDARIKDDRYIYMVLEYGEIDLAHMLAKKWKELDDCNGIIDENWLRFYWQQILLAVNTIHEERIVHSDLKPANFLLVKGSLKLIDFGIAKAIMSDTTNIQRDSQMGTLSYMSPEAFMCSETDSNGNTIKCGRSSDIWSLGCILYQMVYGRTPFSEFKTFWAKFKVITDPTHRITYEPISNRWLLDLMKNCLAWDRNERWRIPQLLQHPFLVPSKLSGNYTPERKGLTLFRSIADLNADGEGVRKLCFQLHEMVTGSGVGLDSVVSKEELRKLVGEISGACSRLQDELGRQ